MIAKLRHRLLLLGAVVYIPFVSSAAPYRLPDVDLGKGEYVNVACDDGFLWADTQPDGSVNIGCLISYHPEGGGE